MRTLCEQRFQFVQPPFWIDCIAVFCDNVLKLFRTFLKTGSQNAMRCRLNHSVSVPFLKVSGVGLLIYIYVNSKCRDLANRLLVHNVISVGQACLRALNNIVLTTLSAASACF